MNDDLKDKEVWSLKVNVGGKALLFTRDEGSLTDINGKLVKTFSIDWLIKTIQGNIDIGTLGLYLEEEVGKQGVFDLLEEIQMGKFFHNHLEGAYNYLFEHLLLEIDLSETIYGYRSTYCDGIYKRKEKIR